LGNARNATKLLRKRGWSVTIRSKGTFVSPDATLNLARKRTRDAGRTAPTETRSKSAAEKLRYEVAKLIDTRRIAEHASLATKAHFVSALLARPYSPTV
jgi:hypothetical protein